MKKAKRMQEKTPMQERLIEAILELQDEFDRAPYDYELASHMGRSRQRVSALITKSIRDGLIRRVPGKIEVL